MCTKRDTRCATAARRTFSSPRRITASLPRAKWTTASQPSIARSDRKSTRLNSSHDQISYAVFCLKKKKKKGIFRTDRNSIHLKSSEKKKFVSDRCLKTRTGLIIPTVIETVCRIRDSIYNTRREV